MFRRFALQRNPAGRTVREGPPVPKPEKRDHNEITVDDINPALP